MTLTDEQIKQRAAEIVIEEFGYGPYSHEREVIERALRESMKADDPELDGTPMAHPAYWRGNDDGVRGAADRWREALEHPIPKPGAMREPLESLYRRTEALREGMKVPDGWQLVPVEPTLKMLSAGRRSYAPTIKIWRNLLAAAPKVQSLNLDRRCANCTQYPNCDCGLHDAGA